jgi:exopolyphosphatase / guanosine-5'-triphosphate,3'-diphosphate pyrophosphatase
VSEVYAALDCGTNSTRLLIENEHGDALVREMRITRLGQGVDATGALHPDAIERTYAVLREYRQLMDNHGVTQGRLAATSAARDASNGPAFLAGATEITGVAAEILSGQEEGLVSFTGAMRGLEPAEGADVVLDIGGGSSELVMVHDGHVDAYSMQVGCVRVTERTLISDPPTAGELATARALAESELDRALEKIPALGSLPPGSRLVALAGTVATIAQVDQQLAEYEREKVHHYWLSFDAVRRWLDVLGAERAAERARRPGMVPGREDVIVGGLVVLVATMERLGFDGCLTSESDILDGLVDSMRATCGKGSATLSR